ncbi:MAG: TetR/AcrR family transcriptional regulator, partial [Candidatus Neomarinimicrobiota bacterium]
MTTISRRESERNARKKLILNSALEVFKSKGIEHATMDEIALEADFGKATLYYYFKSKEEIFNTILVTGWITLWDSVEDIVLDENTPRKQFIKIIKRLIELVNDNRPLYEFLFFAPQTLPATDGIEPEWKQYQTKLTNTLHQLIKIGIEKKEFPQIDSQLTLKALGFIFHGMILMGEDRENISEEEVEELFIKFLKKRN